MSGKNVSLGQVSELLIGFAFKSTGFLDDGADGIRLVRGDNVQQGNIRWGDKAKKWALGDSELLSRYQLRLGDVLLAMDRPVVGGGLKLAWVTKNMQHADFRCGVLMSVNRLSADNIKPDL